MKYDYNVTYVTGKSNVIPDTLSRAPIISDVAYNYELINVVKEAAEPEFSDILITDQNLVKIKEVQNNDLVCKTAMCYYSTEWPNAQNLLPVLKPFYHVREELLIDNGLLLRAGRIIIPNKLQPEILRRIHAGHLRVEKCWWRARHSV